MIIQQERIHTHSMGTENHEDLLLAPCFLMRVTGLPFSTVEQLQFPRTMAMIKELLSIEAWQSEHSNALQDALREECKLIQEKELQHKGLDLRRAMASQNATKAHKLLHLLAPHLPEELACSCEEWCKYSLRRGELLSRGELTLQEELAENRKKLRQFFRHDAFQHGLLLSSDTLYSELQNYLNTPAEKSNNRLRRAEEGLLSYFVRMATKTSPFSTFCSTTVGSWQQCSEYQSSSSLTIHNWQQQRHIRLHPHLLNTIIQMLVTRPEIRPYLHPTLNTTLHWISESQSTEQPVDARTGEKIEILVQDEVKGRKYSYQERLARIRVNPRMRAIITCIEQHNGTLTYRDIVDHVTDSLLPDINDAAQRSQVEQKVAATLEVLAQHTVIALDLRIPAHEDNKLRFLLNQLATIPGTWVAEIRHTLEQIQQVLDGITSATAQELEHLLPRLRDQIIDVCREIGSLQDPPWDPTETVNKIYPTLILEDATLPHAQVSLERQAWQPVLQDLTALQEIAPLLDLAAVAKINMDHWAREALAQLPSHSEDLMTCHMRFWKEFMLNDEVQQRWKQQDPHFAQLREQQRALTTLLAGRIQQAQQEQAHIVHIDPNELHQLAQSFPAFLRQRYPLAHFGQLFFEQGEPHMMLNAIWTGPGTAFSRFSYPFQHLTVPGTPDAADRETVIQALRAYITKLGRRYGLAYASIAETGGINVNTHCPLTPYEILFPLSISQHPQEEQLSLRELRVRLHAQTHEFELFSPRLQTSIAPLHLGFSLIQMMPPLYQALVTTATHYPLHDIVTLLESRLTAEQKQEVRHYPRIALGHIILNRECWKIPAAMIPRREAGETAFDYFLKLNRWRSDLGLSNVGFRRVIAASEIEDKITFLKRLHQLPVTEKKQIDDEQDKQETSGKTEKGTATRHISDTLSKPFYLDFENYFLLALFNTAMKALPDEETLTIEEVLPTPGQHLLREGQESYSTEFILELSC